MSPLIFIGAAFILSSCAQGISTKYSVIPSASFNKNITTTLSYGQIVAVQKKRNIVAVYIDEGQVGSDLSMSVYVAIQNITNKKIRVKPDHVQIEVVSSKKKQRLTPYSKHEVISKTEQEYRNQAAFQSIMGALSAASASYSASTTYHSGTINQYGTVDGYIGSTPVYGTYSSSGIYTGTSYNPAMGQLAADVQNLKTERKVNDIYSRMNSHLFELQRVLFDHHTIQPKETYAGATIVRPHTSIDKPDQIIVTVLVNGQKYLFTYNVSTNDKPW